MAGTGYLQPMRCFVETEYLFAHAVVREAVYAMQSVQERAELHGLAVQVMEQIYPKAERGTIARAIARHAAEAFRAVASKLGKPKPKLAAKFQAL